MEGRAVVVTGGAHGIGAALGREAAARGASSVVIMDLLASEADEVARSIRDRGTEARGVGCDVTDRDAVMAVAAEVAGFSGVPGVVCANAGVIGPPGRLLDMDTSQIRWVLEVNLLGLIWTLQAFGRLMEADTQQGWLMATSSEHAFGVAHLGAAPYTASKHAVLGLCDILRGELPDNVGVSVLCPGLTVSTLWQSEGRRPGRFGGPSAPDASSAAVIEHGMSAETVAERAFDGLAAGRFLIPTHYNALDYGEARWRDVQAAFEELAKIDTSCWHVGDIARAVRGRSSNA
ncbi:MAG: SDR family NAD(P)-dependent oxidoreductase [Acidimicrobiales bacterium]|nr:SDR family NAD(P)-dependent oxidoreductase [Acidimicrobiales bacterium]